MLPLFQVPSFEKEFSRIGLFESKLKKRRDGRYRRRGSRYNHLSNNSNYDPKSYLTLVATEKVGKNGLKHKKILDSGATQHITNTMNLFTKTRPTTSQARWVMNQ